MDSARACQVKGLELVCRLRLSWDSKFEAYVQNYSACVDALLAMVASLSKDSSPTHTRLLDC